MTAKQTLLLLVTLAMLQTNAQPVMDGVINSSENYILISSYNSTNNGFGNGNDLGALYYRYGVTGGVPYIYIGITGRIDGSNNIVLFLDFSNYAGRSSGTLGGNVPSTLGVFSSSTGAGDCSGNGGLNSARLSSGFDADYAFAFNEGNGTSSLFCDAMRFSALGSTPDGYFEQGFVGSVNQTGTSGTFSPLPFSVGCGANCPGSMTFAYRGDYNTTTNTNHGIEMRIPVRSLPGVAPGDFVKFFVVITNPFGFMSNESLPSIIVGNNPGCDADLSGYNNLFTGLWLLPVNFLDFKVTPEKQSLRLQWKVSGNADQQYYLVEKSRDGNRFTPFATVPATVEEPATYSLLDPEPQPGWNFYRVTAVDQQQRKKLSGIIKAYSGGKTNAAIVPNPVQGTTLQFYSGNLAAGAYQLSVFSAAGQQLYTSRWVHDGLRPVYQLKPGLLPPGNYWLVLQQGTATPVKLPFLQQ
ncbi:MAG TPA: hypothetical protein VFV46_00180 [Lacibacter sp.]|nr:hypothetical protein [Lacibacter sp.]